MDLNFGTFVFTAIPNAGDFRGNFIKIGRDRLNEDGVPLQFKQYASDAYATKTARFSDVPGYIAAYPLSDDAIDSFSSGLIANVVIPAQGSTLGHNESFLRYWHELDGSKLAGWRTCLKGGAFRKWYGNVDYVVDWRNNGKVLKSFERAYLRNIDKMERDGIDWSRVTSNYLGFRSFDGGSFIESGGGFIYIDGRHNKSNLLGFLNSHVAREYLGAMVPTLNCQTGDLIKLPYIDVDVSSEVDVCVALAREEWHEFETATGFESILVGGDAVSNSVLGILNKSDERIRRMHAMETAINTKIANKYRLDIDKNTPVLLEEITLRRQSVESCVSIIVSYSIGCMMGRYSLDEPGLIYANSGNVGFDPSRYATFPADDDGIVPIMQTDWFDDDATNRVVEFFKVAWTPETLTENLKFVADSLGAKSGETPIDTIRRYLSSDFFKDHLKTYKRRPIYWLFSSGKEKAFEALVYLHRYNEGTLSRMRMECVTPLQGRIASRIDQLGRDIDAAASTAAQNKLRKEQEKLKKQQAELVKYDEELRHYADMRIKLDLDDGVKVNYGKFGNLLAEVKAITGGSDE
ncbi:BREX-1 system adenine-specific DNA-methyltransferase PglX [Paramagnetospirillum caucaseum]|uniref:BREX-1 system adenine-specific DNA-methyltransferase PglX n=1 Tax=Paramagnetospirillum caucaseum TaxID=1244869 RepID=UPI00034BEAC2|nr:BREX-1 system adenine-specific DNA-methyltransferase PglX [Paramagnetospirillum caucaseum]